MGYPVIRPGTANHSNLTNLNVDDHLQYHTDARGDARYYTKAEIDALVLDDLFDVDAPTPTDGQVLAFNIGTGKWEPSSSVNGGSKFFHHNAGLVQTFTAATTILFNTAGIAEADYSYAAGEVTINRTDWYNVSYEVTAGTGTNNRTTSTHQLEVNTVLVPGSISNGYHRNISNGEQTSTANVLVLLTAGDVLRVRSSGDGSITTIANGCRLTIESK